MGTKRSRYKVALLSGSLTMLLVPSAWGMELLVFVPSVVKAYVVKKEVQTACPSDDVIVFSAGRDFRRRLKTTAVPVVITLPVAVNGERELIPLAQGSLAGSTQMDYLVVSINEAIKDLKGKTIGVYSLLPRQPMRALVRNKIGVDVEIKTVSKLVDLLSLLIFQEVDAIWISLANYQVFREYSQLSFVVTATSASLELPQLMIADTTIRQTALRCLSNFSNELNEMLGVDNWVSLTEPSWNEKASTFPEWDTE